MTDKTYNGWTNYATWRVNLEVFDGMNIRDHFDELPDIYAAADWCEQYAQELLDAAMREPFGSRSKMLGPCDVVSGWAIAFLHDVDWLSIANHLIDYAQEVEA